MYYKQNLKNKNKSLSTILSQQTSLTNQKILYKLWQQYKVNQAYQQIILSYLDTITTHQDLSRQLSKQIRRTHQKDNYYFHIQQLLKQRSKTLVYLYQQTSKLQYHNSQGRSNRQPNLEEICDGLDDIRKYHLLISQKVYQMVSYYKCQVNGVNSSSIGYYLGMFKSFDSDMQFLKESLLQYYVPFSRGFDPLFLEPLKLIKEGVMEGKLVYDPYIAQLFNLNPSYMYRMLRAHQRMLGYISYVNQEKEPDILKFKYNSQERKPSIENKQMPIRLVQYQRPILKRQREKQKLQRPQYKKQDRNITQAVDYTYRPKMSFKTQPTAKLKSQPLKIKQSKKNIKYLKLVQQYNFNYQNQDSKRSKIALDLKQQDVKVHQYDDRREQSTNRHHNIYNKEARSWKRLSPGMDSTNDRILVRQNQNQRTNNLEDEIKESRYQKHQFPKINIQSRLQCDNSHRSRMINDSHQDCLCRQKYKEKNNKSAEYQLSELQASEKRRKIIESIKMKHKALAEKQILYQISKVGDKVYHRMKASRKKQLSSNVKQKAFY